MLSRVKWPPYLFIAFRLAKSFDLSPKLIPASRVKWLFDCVCRTSIGTDKEKDAREYCPEDDDNTSLGRLRRIVIWRKADRLDADFVMVNQRERNVVMFCSVLWVRLRPHSP